MIEMRPYEGSAGDWDRDVDRAAGASLMQLWEYGDAKAATGGWSIERAVFAEGQAPVAVAQVLIRRLPMRAGGLAWINRGPLLLEGAAEGAALAPVLRAASASFARDRRLLLRVAPPLESVSMSGVPPPFEPRAEGWRSGRLDLRPGLDAVRASLDKKWRNALTKAGTLGLEISVADTPAAIESIAAVYAEHQEARGYRGIEMALLRALQRSLPDGRRLLVLRAEHEGAFAGAAVIAQYGATCEYLAGITGERGRRVNAMHALLWRAVEEASRRGRHWFDLGGMHPERTPPGVYHFKQGLRPAPYELARELESREGGFTAAALRRILRVAGR